MTGLSDGVVGGLGRIDGKVGSGSGSGLLVGFGRVAMVGEGNASGLCDGNPLEFGGNTIVGSLDCCFCPVGGFRAGWNNFSSQSFLMGGSASGGVTGGQGTFSFILTIPLFLALDFFEPFFLLLKLS